MNDIHHPEDWQTVLDENDRAALAAYARPRGPLSIRRPALLVIDVTVPFVGPDAPVREAQQTSRQACGERAWRAVPAMVRALGAFRAAGLPVVYTVPDPIQRWTGAATRGAVDDPDAAAGGILEEVAPVRGEQVVRKSKASAFFGTPLASGLVRDGVDAIVLVGGTTSGCIRATAIDGSSAGFEVVVVEDAVFDRSRLSHLVSLADLDVKYARVLPADLVIRLLQEVEP